jgi:hypothetical protein
MPALLDLVRKVIDYGKELAAALHQRAAENPYFAVLDYGSNDLALVLACITRGLLRAKALEERLVRLAARPERRPVPTKTASQRAPRPARPAGRRAQPADCFLTHMPNEEEIAAEVRRRPIGAVLLDICRDLAIRPSHPLWRDIQKAVMQYGGGCARLVKHVLTSNIRLAAELVAPPEPPSLSSPPACTGPP